MPVIIKGKLLILMHILILESKMTTKKFLFLGGYIYNLKVE